MKNLTPIFASAALAASVGAQAVLVDFDDNALGVDDYYGSNYFNAAVKQSTVAPWTSAGINFDYSYNYFDPYEWWTDFTYSNQTAAGAGGQSNQYRAVTGDGVGANQDNYAIGTGYQVALSIDLGSASVLDSAYFTNTEYSYYTMLNGGSFGATAFTTGDFFGVTVSGLDSNGNTTNSLDVFLAEDSSILNVWSQVDLSLLGVVHGVQFEVFSSQTGQPYYFAMDSLSYQTVPVPAAAWLFGSALLGLVYSRKRR